MLETCLLQLGQLACHHFFLGRKYQAGHFTNQLISKSIHNLQVNFVTGQIYSVSLIDPGKKLVFTDGYTEGWKPAEKPFMTAILLLEDVGEGKTRYTAIARHPTKEIREQHEQMGFHEGWGIVLDQLVKYVKGLNA